MSDQREIAVAVVGVGSLGKIHAKVYSELKGCRLDGVYDVNPEAAAEVAAMYGCRVYNDLEDLASHADAASVVVPTDHHRSMAGKLLNLNLHLLVEKPIASTTAEAEELVSLAEAHNRILQVGHVERFNPVMHYLEEVAERPRFIEAHRLAPYPPPRPGMTPRGTEVSVVLDLMIHDLEIILHLVGSSVCSIHAVGVPVLSPTEDIANVRLGFENGCVANVTASRISPERMRKIRVFLEDAYISLDYQKQEGEVFRKQGLEIRQEMVPIEKQQPLQLELGSFVDCVRHHGEPVVSGAHAARALTLAVEILKKIKQAKK